MLQASENHLGGLRFCGGRSLCPTVYPPVKGRDTVAGMSRSKANVTVWESDDLEDHCALIARQVDRSLMDPETRKLAVKIAGHKPDGFVTEKGRRIPVVTAWGHDYYLPDMGADPCAAKDDACEVQAVWNFLVANVRYVLDPDGYDLFCTLQRTLEAGAGDCFPVETLVLHESGEMRPIGDVQVGDRIHDGEKFVEVLKVWERTTKQVHAVGLSNNSTLRLSPEHKVLRVPRADYTNPNTGAVLRGCSPGAYDMAEEARVESLALNDDLLQPRAFAAGRQRLDPDIAFLVGAYLAEGWVTDDRLYIAGIANSKGVRERVEQIYTKLGVPFTATRKDIRAKVADVPVLPDLGLGRVAAVKHLPHVDWDNETAAAIVLGMEMGDGGWSTSGKNMVYSTISRELALQYRVLKRQLGFSTSMKCLVDHGGAGQNPIYRVTVRVDDKFKPWARIRSLAVEPEERECVDITTATGRVYLPEADVIVHNCDDATICFAALLRALGFSYVAARVVSTNGERWEHVYPVVALPKQGRARKLVALDITVSGSVPGWEYPKITHRVDYKL